MALFDFYSQYPYTSNFNRHKTVLLAGVKGSGKSSFALYYVMRQIEDNKDFDYKHVFINIDGFSPKQFDALAALNRKETQFYWLNFEHFIKFAEIERELYKEANASIGEKETGQIATYVRENMPDEFKRYLDSMIICDEADAYHTSYNADLANFYKFSRHYYMEIWLLTQKFQNLNPKYYNANAINHYFMIRNPLFNYFGFRYIEHWSATDTTNPDNLETTWKFKIDDRVFDMYDSGANLNQKSKIGKLTKIMIMIIPFGIFLAYIQIKSLISTDEPMPQPKPHQSIIKHDLNKTALPTFALDDKALVKALTFGKNTNFYYKGRFASHDNDFLSDLLKQYDGIKQVFTHGHIAFYSVPADILSMLFPYDLSHGKKSKVAPDANDDTGILGSLF